MKSEKIIGTIGVFMSLILSKLSNGSEAIFWIVISVLGLIHYSYFSFKNLNNK